MATPHCRDAPRGVSEAGKWPVLPQNTHGISRIAGADNTAPETLAASWSSLPRPGEACRVLEELAASWRSLPRPGGACRALEEPAAPSRNWPRARESCRALAEAAAPARGGAR